MPSLETLLPLVSPVVLLIVKSALVVAAAALVCALMLSRSSAALRHGVWAGALAGVFALPLLTALPGWSWRVIPADTNDTAQRPWVASPPDSDPATVVVEAGTDSSIEASPAEPHPIVSNTDTRDEPAHADTRHQAAVHEDSSRTTPSAVATKNHEPTPGSAQTASSTTAQPAPASASAREPAGQQAVPTHMTGAGSDKPGQPPVAGTPTEAQQDHAINWPLWLAGAWAAGGLIAAAPLMIGLLRLRSAVRHAQPLGDQAVWAEALEQSAERVGLRRGVRLLACERTRIPVTFGLIRPTVLLPTACEQWDADQRAMVLMHELAHIARRDWLWMLVARLAVAAHWFNPLVRYGARRMHDEAERAADDIVLTGGCAASAYATCLYQMVCIDRTPRATAAALPMGRGVDTARRLQMILDESNSRQPMNKRLAWRTALAVAALALPVGLTQLAEAQQETAAEAPAAAEEHAADTAVGEAADTAHDAAAGEEVPADTTADAAEEAVATKIAEQSQDDRDHAERPATADNPLIGTWRIVHMPDRGDLPDDLPRDTNGHLRMFIDFDAEGRATFRAPGDIDASRYRIDPVKRQVVVYQEGREDRPELVDTYSFSDNGRGLTLQPSGLVLERYGDDHAHSTPASPARLLGTWEVRDPDGDYEGAIRFHENGTAEIWEDEDGHPSRNLPRSAVRYAVGEGTLDLILPDGDTEHMSLLIQGNGRMSMDQYTLVRIDATLGTVTTGAGAHGDSTAPVDEHARKLIQALFEKRVSVDFHDVPFSDVVGFLQDVTGANIFINTRSLDNKGVAMDALVTMKLDDVKALTVLELAIDLISDDIELDYKDTVLVIE